MSAAFLTVDQAAERYSLSAYTIREKCRAGLLPCVKHSGAKSWLLPVAWLDAYDQGAPLERVRTRAPRRGEPASVVVRPCQEVTA